MKNNLYLTTLICLVFSTTIQAQELVFKRYDINEYLYAEGYEIEDNYPLEGKCEGQKKIKKMYKTGMWTYYLNIPGEDYKYIAFQGEYDRDNEIGEWVAYYSSLVGLMYFKGSFSQTAKVPFLDSCDGGIRYCSYPEGDWTIYTLDGEVATIYSLGNDSNEPYVMVDPTIIKTVFQDSLDYGNGQIGQGEGVLSGMHLSKGYSLYKIDFIKSMEEMGSFIRTGLWKQLDSDGNLVAEANYDYKTNQVTGLTTFYFKNGGIKSQGNKKDDIKVGEWKTFYESGELETVVNFENGNYSGAYRSYYKNGKVELERQYKNDTLEGPSVSYFENGMKKNEGNYVHGKLNGVYKSYFANGKTETEANYNIGVLHGLYTSYYENGIKNRESNYSNSKLNGTDKLFFTNGQLHSETTYKMGAIVDKVVNYHFNGKLLGEEMYGDNGGYIGPLSYFDKSGNCILKDGTGIYQNLFINGEVSVELNFKNGCREGLGTWYYDNGQIESSIIYKYDESTKPMGLRWESVSSFNRDGSIRDKGTLKEGNGYTTSYDANGVMSKRYFQNGRPIE